MVKEVISINIGQAGIQLSNAAWELFCMEHGIRSDGFNVSRFSETNSSQLTFFSDVGDRFVPRCLTLDFEPTVVDEIRLGVYRNLFNPRFLVSGFEDASGNFARGCFTEGKKFIISALENVRKLVENCSCLEAFCFLNSYDGGTGSGFTSLLEEEMVVDYSKITKLQLGILPSNKLASSTVYPYNSLLHTSYTISYIDICPMLDNETIYNVCTNKLKTDRPSFTNINRLIGQIFSNITVSLRYENHISSSLDQLSTNLIPYPKLHFTLVHSSPICEQSVYDKIALDINEITNELFELDNQLTNCDHREGKFMACNIQYRGDVSAVEVNKAINNVKRRQTIQFVDWCPTGFKIGISSQPPASPPGSIMAQMRRNATMLSNTSAIGCIWNSLLFKFDCLYSKRAFLHWFVGEGLEEQEFAQSKDVIMQLKLDYEEIATSSQPEKKQDFNVNQANSAVGFFNDMEGTMLRRPDSTNSFPLEF